MLRTEISAKPKASNICPNCGASMSDRGYKYHCDYCGTEVDQQTLAVLHIEPSVRIASSKQIVDAEMYHLYPNDVEQTMRKGLCEQLARLIMEHGAIQVETEYDPCTNNIIFSSKIRFLDSDFKI